MSRKGFISEQISRLLMKVERFILGRLEDEGPPTSYWGPGADIPYVARGIRRVQIGSGQTIEEVGKKNSRLNPLVADKELDIQTLKEAQALTSSVTEGQDEVYVLLFRIKE